VPALFKDVQATELLGDMLDHRPGFLGTADVRLVENGSSPRFVISSATSFALALLE